MEAVLVRDDVGDGVAFFGHGQSDFLEGTDERPLFPGIAAQRLDGRWVHALACDAGREWADRIVRGGARAVVGYTGMLSVNWHPDFVPTELADVLGELVSAVTSTLAGGQTDPVALQSSMVASRNAILLWVGSHPGAADGLAEFCNQLFTSIRVVPSPAAPHAPGLP